MSGRAGLLRDPQNFARIVQQDTGYTPAALQIMVELGAKIQQGGSFTARDVDALCHAHPHVGREQILDRVEAIMQAPAHERFNSFIAQVTAGNSSPEAIDYSRNLVDGYVTHKSANSVSDRLDAAQATADRHAGRQQDTQRPAQDPHSIRSTLDRQLRPASERLQQMHAELPHVMADKLDRVALRLDEDRRADVDRPARDTIADAFDQHQTQATAVEVGLLSQAEVERT